jgi:hypothetical protein
MYKCVKLYQEFDKEKEPERFRNLKKGVERKEFHRRVIETCRHFEKLQEFIENKYHDCSTLLINIFVGQNLFY